MLLCRQNWINFNLYNIFKNPQKEAKVWRLRVQVFTRFTLRGHLLLITDKLLLPGLRIKSFYIKFWIYMSIAMCVHLSLVVSDSTIKACQSKSTLVQLWFVSPQKALHQSNNPPINMAECQWHEAKCQTKIWGFEF